MSAFKVRAVGRVAIAAGSLLGIGATTAVITAPPASALLTVRIADPLADAAGAARQSLWNLRAAQAAAPPDVTGRRDGLDPVMAALEGRAITDRQVVVAQVATRIGVVAASLDAAWAGTTDARLVAVLSALSQVGVRYRWLSGSPDSGFDCSGLVNWAWQQAGVSVARNSEMLRGSLPEVPVGQALPGDVGYYPGHVELYLGVGVAMVEAPYTGERVRVRLSESPNLRLLNALG